MKYHLFSLLSPFLEIDIIPFWIEHYMKLNLDSYNVILHIGENDTNTIVQKARNLFKRYEWNVCLTWPDVYDYKTIRYTAMKPLIDQLEPNDMVIYCDGDEFQEWPNNSPQDFLQGVDGARGYLMDRFNSTLRKCSTKYKTIDEQYPFECKDLELEIDGGFIIKRFDKVCACKASFPISLSGLHDLEVEHPQCLLRGDLKIHHFKWRENYIDRMSTCDFSNIKLLKKATKEFFNGKF